MSSGESRIYRVTQLRTNGVHCLEPAGTGPVVFKIVPVTGVALRVSRVSRCEAVLHPGKGCTWHLMKGIGSADWGDGRPNSKARTG